MNLDPIFRPKSIAIVGASERVGYEGGIYPINPNQKEIWGVTCYPNVASMPTVPQIASIAGGIALRGAG